MASKWGPSGNHVGPSGDQMRTRAGEAKIPDGPMRSDIGSWHMLAKNGVGHKKPDGPGERGRHPL